MLGRITKKLRQYFFFRNIKVSRRLKFPAHVVAQRSVSVAEILLCVLTYISSKIRCKDHNGDRNVGNRSMLRNGANNDRRVVIAKFSY